MLWKTLAERAVLFFFFFALFCFFKFTGQRFNFSASLSGPSSLLLSIKHKPCLWVRLPGPCLDSAGTGYRLSTLQREFSGDGQRRRVTPRLSSKKTAPPGGARPLHVPAHGLLSHSYCLHVSSPPLRPVPSTVYSFTSLTFILPASPRVLFLCVSPSELCGGAARADSFDLGAVHVVEIRGPAALPSRRSRNGALARENKPLFSGAFFWGGGRIGGEVKAAQLAESILAR